ncbi:MAG: hypothetical protein Q7T55_24450 [Solirubrobacteraceae bacterium]|nr:hypothetical protein [Solirubrobacteraceae bacterium]
MTATSTTDFDLGRHRDLRGRERHTWYRRAALGVMLAVIVAALAGAFGQMQSTRAATSDAAELEIQMPKTVRGGLLWPMRINVRAKTKIVSPTLVLGSGFIRGMQLNSLEPAPVSEASRPANANGHAPFALTYGTLQPGDTLTVYAQLQVDPTTMGRHDASVSLEGANIRPVRSPAHLNVLP